jgi:hypothetical protein
MKKQKQLLEKKLLSQNTHMDSSQEFIDVDKEHIYHQVLGQLPWLLGLWGELIVLLGVVILKIMT